MAEEPAEAWLVVVAGVEGFVAAGRDSEGAVDGVAAVDTVAEEPSRRWLSHWSLPWNCWPKCWRRLRQVFEGSDSC